MAEVHVPQGDIYPNTSYELNRIRIEPTCRRADDAQVTGYYNAALSSTAGTGANIDPATIPGALSLYPTVGRVKGYQFAIRAQDSASATTAGDSYFRIRTSSNAA